MKNMKKSVNYLTQVHTRITQSRLYIMFLMYLATIQLLICTGQEVRGRGGVGEGLGGGGGGNTDIFHTIVTLENDGHRTWYDSIDPK